MACEELPSWALTVAPKGAVLAPKPANTPGHTTTFDVKNQGGETNTFNLSCRAELNLACTPGSYPATVTILANTDSAVSVTFSTTTTGGTGRLWLIASSPHGPVADSGYVDVPVVSYSVIVTPDGQSTSRRFDAPFREVFTIRNSGTAANTYALAAGCSGALTQCTGPSRTSLTLQPGLSDTASIGYRTGMSGSGTVTLTATGTSATDNGSYAITVLTGGVTVTPDGATAPARREQTNGHTAAFTVQNVGALSDSYTLQCSGTNGVTCTGLSTGSPLSLGGGTSQTVTATYNVGAATSGGTLTVSASGAHGSDQGFFTVPIVRYTVAVTPDGGSAGERGSGTSPHEHGFVVRNTGTIGDSYTLACSATAHLSCMSVVPASVSLAPGDSLPVTVRYAVNTTLGAATLTLTATSQQASGVSDAGTAGVTVVDLSPAELTLSNLPATQTWAPETGPYTYTFTVNNPGGQTGSYQVGCTSTSPTQLPCGTPSPATFSIAGHGSQVVTVTYSTLGLGDFTHTVGVGLGGANPRAQAFPHRINVRGTSFIAHMHPLDDITVGTGDTLRAVLRHASGIRADSIRVYIDGVHRPTATYAAGTLTLGLTGLGLQGGEHSWTTRACTLNGRCESALSSLMLVAPPTPFALDDSLPRGTSSDLGLGTGFLGPLPPPPLNLRGCAATLDHPEMQMSPGRWFNQPGEGVRPAGIVFGAAAIAYPELIIHTTTVDQTPSLPRPTCSSYVHLSRSQFDWSYWEGVDREDPLWDGYATAFGEQLSSRDDDVHFDLPRELAAATHGPALLGRHSFGMLGRRRIDGAGAAPLVRRPVAALGGLTERAVLAAATHWSTGGLAALVPDAGAINPDSFNLTLNGTPIVVNGQVAPGATGVQILSRERVGATVQVPAGHPLLRQYNPSNPFVEHGWNELIGSIADSTGHRTSLRARFTMMRPGPIEPLALKARRDFAKADQGECAAFGPFQCGGVMLAQTIPTFVKRDRERALHLVYHSTTQRPSTIAPIEVEIRRDQKAPDSLWVTPYVAGVAVGPTLRYAGLKGPVSGHAASNLYEDSDERRVLGAEIDATWNLAQIRRVTIRVRGFYTGPVGEGVVRDDSLTQDVVQFASRDYQHTRFGHGWQLAELGRLVLGETLGTDPAAIWLSGDGSYAIFRSVGGVWQAPAGEAVRMVQLGTPLNGATYVIYLDNGAAVGFRSSDGRQVWTMDLVGNRTTYTYGGGGDLLSLTDPSGEKINFLYESGLMSTGITVDKVGGGTTRIATLSYSSTTTNARLRQVKLHRSDTAADSTRFTYATSGSPPGAFIDSVVDPRSTASQVIATKFTYDPANWAPLGATRPASRIGFTQTASIRDAWRRAVPRQGFGRGTAGSAANTQALERLVFSSQLRGTSIAFAGPATDYTVDRFGHPTWVRVIAPEAANRGGFYWETFGGDDVRVIARDSVGRATLIVQAPDSAATVDSLRYEYDALGRVSRLIRLTAKSPVVGDTTRDSVQFTYDSLSIGTGGQWCSRLLSVRDAMGGVTTTVYGTSGVERCLPKHIIGAANDTTTFTYGTLTAGHVATTRPTKVRDPNGLEQSVSYEGAHWNTGAVTRLADTAVTQLYYGALGRPDSVVDPVGKRTWTVRDRLGRVTHQQVGSGALAPLARTTYLPGGFVAQTDVYAAANASDTLPDGGPIQSTRTFYDRAGLVDSVVSPGSQTTPSASGHLARRQWYTMRDNFGNPTYELPGNGSAIGRLYDWRGRVTFANYSETSPLFSWDGERFADPASLAWFTSLALPMGRVQSTGQVHTYTYTNKGQIAATTSRDQFSGAIGERHRGYSRTGQLIADALIFADGATIVRRYEYNRRGQRVRAVDTVTVASGHQLNGESTGEIRYVYHATTARLDSLVGAAGGTVYARAAFTYDRGGRETQREVALAEWAASQKLITTRTYDRTGRDSTIWTRTVGFGTADTTWYRFTTGAAAYSKVDELLSFSTTEPGGATFARTYAYTTDGTRRLRQTQTGLKSYTWDYDVFGNRASQIRNTEASGSCFGTAHHTYAEDNRLLSTSKERNEPECHVSRYWYDQAGHRLGEQDTTETNQSGVPPINGLHAIMTYTAAGQLYFSATPASAAGVYDFNWHWYDADGLRLVSQVGSRGGAQGPGLYPIPPLPDSVTPHRTHFVYDGADVALVLLQDRWSTNPRQWSVHQRLLSGGVDQVLAGRYRTPYPVQNLVTLADRQGTTLGALKAGGVQECRGAQYHRNAFGTMESARVAGCGSGTGGLGTGYTGAGTPNATGGFTYLRNRWYDPGTGRFLTQDPIGLAGGVNLYAYAGNNPIAFSDPFGLMECSWDKPKDCKVASLKVGFTAFGHKAKGQLGPLRGEVGGKVGATTGIALTGGGLRAETDASASVSVKLTSGENSVGGTGTCSASTASCKASASASDGTGTIKTTNWAIGGEVTTGNLTVGAEVDVKGAAIVAARGVHDGALFLVRALAGLAAPKDLGKPVIQIHSEQR